MDGTCYGSTQSPMGFQKPCVTSASIHLQETDSFHSRSEVTTVQADPNLSILAFKDSLLSIQHDLKVIDAINDIRTPFSDEKISPRSLDGNVPVVENRNAKTSTDVPASTRHQPSQSTPSTPTLPEYQTHLVTHNIGDTKLASTFDDGSSPYRSFENRPQLCQWLNETENSNLTVTEILEKSNWEPDGSKTSSLPALASHLQELSKLVSI